VTLAPVPASDRLDPARPFLAASVAVFRDGRVLVAAGARAPMARGYGLPGGLPMTRRNGSGQQLKRRKASYDGATRLPPSNHIRCSCSTAGDESDAARGPNVVQDELLETRHLPGRYWRGRPSEHDLGADVR
jgi:hypothetical protein